MSLLIKGMDMPKHAIKNGTDDTLYRSCVIVHPDGTAELILDSTFADMFGFEHNLNRFPLVEIPTPHGDLIDSGDVLDEINRIFPCHSDEYEWAYTTVEQADTIIEAEE